MCLQPKMFKQAYNVRYAFLLAALCLLLTCVGLLIDWTLFFRQGPYNGPYNPFLQLFSNSNLSQPQITISDSKLYGHSNGSSHIDWISELNAPSKLEGAQSSSLYERHRLQPAHLVKDQWTLQLPDGTRRTENYKRVCYYRLPESDTADTFQPEDVDPFLCTHLILCAGDGARVVNDTIQLSSPHDEKSIMRTVALRTLNPDLKLMISVMLGFSELVANRTAVISFAYKARMFVERLGLDGLDLDWEFPAWSPDPATGEKWLFVNLVDKLSTALRLVQPAYLLSAAVTGIQPILDDSYDIPGLARNVDFLCLMGYDYHMYKGYFPFTDHNAPLLPHAQDLGYFATLNLKWSVAALLERGLSKEQLVVGVPIYGRTWRLLSASWQGLHDPAVGPGFGKGYVSYPGALAFARSADRAERDEEARVPWAARGRDWISYEDETSAAEKAAWVRSEGLAGVMTFDLGSDDWDPTAHPRFPLHSAIKRALTGGRNFSSTSG